MGTREDDDPLLRSAADHLAAYFERDLKEFDLPLAPRGTDFQQRVWAQLRLIGYGETASYGEVAHRLGMTNAASRAVGLANGRNPIPIVIPCHRVDWGQRHPHRLCRWAAAQADPARAGAGRAVAESPVLRRVGPASGVRVRLVG